MNNNQFVETYYKDIKNACSKYYNMINNYIEYEDFLQQTYCIFLKRKSFDESYNVKPFTFICTVVKNLHTQYKYLSYYNTYYKHFLYHYNKFLQIDYYSLNHLIYTIFKFSSNSLTSAISCNS